MRCKLVFIGLIWVLSLQSVCVSSKDKKIPARPKHVVMILVDDAGLLDFEVYNPLYHTPNINALASDGITLENYYVQSICSPTRAALLTGRYPMRYGMQADVAEPISQFALPLNESIIPQYLKERGYATHIVGKWHLGFFQPEQYPHLRGFDDFFGMLAGMWNQYTHTDKFTLPDIKVLEGSSLYRNLQPVYSNDTVIQSTGNFSTHIITSVAKDIIMNHDPDVPLFLYLPYTACHSPFQCPLEDYIRCSKMPDENDGIAHHKFDPTIWNEGRSAAYAAQIRCGMMVGIDDAVGNITNSLKTAGIYDDTLFIFSTDNGGLAGSNWPLKGHKFQIFEGGVRGWGFIRHSQIPSKLRGTRSKALMHVTDWLPTIVQDIKDEIQNNLTKLGPPDGILDGVDMWATLMTGNDTSPRTEILLNSIHDADSNVSSIVTQDGWKLIVNAHTDTVWGYPVEWTKPNSTDAIPKSPCQNLTHLPTPPSSTYFLTYLRNDSSECYNLQHYNPKLVKNLLKRINSYRVHERAPQKNTFDGRSDPDFHGGFWGPWIGTEPAPASLSSWSIALILISFGCALLLSALVGFVLGYKVNPRKLSEQTPDPINGVNQTFNQLFSTTVDTNTATVTTTVDVEQ